jgi:photosystem II stability/assembly factor-like uncharacterized protein
MTMFHCTRILLLVMLAALPAGLFAQPFRTMLYDNRINVNEVIRVADAYFAEVGTGKGTGYKGFQRWRYEYERRFYPSGDRSQFNPRQAWTAYRAFQSASRTSGATGHWTYRGPDDATNTLPPNWAAGLGRIEAVWAGGANADTVYLGSRSGGFWKTFDGGLTWRATTQDLPAVGVVDIEVHPQLRNQVWILTRHATGYTYGLLKSDDFGETWDTTGLSYGIGNAYADEFAFPTPDTLYVATNLGLLRSADGGSTWANVYSGNIVRMLVHPTNSQVLYVLNGNNFGSLRRSTDGGQTWTNHLITQSPGYPFMAVTAAAPDMIYYASNTGIYRSTDRGQSWTFRGADPTNSGFMALGASATNAQHIFAGSLNQYSSTDGGLTWITFADWINPTGTNYVHGDGRVFRAWGDRIYLGTDGFLGFSSDNGVSWEHINNNGTGVREFYRIGCSPVNAEAIVGGSQDNGTSVMLDGTWYDWIGADGMQAHFDRNNPDVWFGTIQFGALQRTTQGGLNASGVAPPTNGTNGAWITPSVIDPSNDNTLFIAFDSVFKSNDNGSTWQGLAAFGGNMDELAIAPSDSNILYMSRGTRLRRSTDNGHTWAFADPGLPSLYITRIAVHPDDPQHVAVSYSGFTASGKVYVSTNGGQSWTNRSGNLPNLPANALAYTEGPPVRLFVGMDVGVYYADAGSSTWIRYDDSLPAVIINDLEVLEGAGLIRAGTWGRGAWEAPLPGREGTPQILHVDLSPRPDDVLPKPSDSVSVQAVIRNAGGIQQAVLRWGTNLNTLTNTIPMAYVQGDSYRTVTPIPTHAEGTRIYFRISATAPNGDSARSERLMYRVKAGILCAAAGSQGTSFDFIDTVRVHTLDHASGQEYYGDFRNLYNDLYRDSSYTLMVSLNYSFPLDTMFAWVDWNGNGTVSEPGEQLLMSALDGDHKSYTTFTVPHVPAVPDTVTMRVRAVYANQPVADPCGDYFGEVEDYSIVLRDLNMVGLADVPSQGLRVWPNPTRDQVRLSWGGDPAAEWELRVSDLQGRAVLPMRRIHGSTQRLDLRSLAPGLYLVELRSEGSALRARVAVER